MKVALIGYGEVGRRLAEDLAGKAEVVAWDIDPAKRPSFAAASAGDAAAGADLVISAVTAANDLAAAQEAAAATARPLPEGARSEEVLLVEDDEDVRTSAVAMLRELGYGVIEAPDGPAALRFLDGYPGIRLLFTDIGLPGGVNGRQLADEARRRRPDLKVLFTTGYARNAIVHHGRLDPGVELIGKPFTYAELAVKVRQVLDKGAAEA